MAEVSPYYSDIVTIFEYELPWEKLSGSKILITGATGLIGSCFVETLLLNPKRDYEVYATGRDKSKLLKRFSQFNNYPEFHLFTYDVLLKLDREDIFDYIIHAASDASPSAFVNNPVEVMKSNLYGVCNLLDYGINNGLKRFLYISSGEIYGEGDVTVISEEYSGYVDCTSPRSCYPSSKRAAETLCVSYKAEYGTDIVIARPCHTYGPYFTETDNRVYAQFIRNVLNDENIVMKSSGEQFRSWCYVVDCVSALFHILLKGESGEAYNIANPDSNVSIKELALIVANIGNKEVIFSSPEKREKAGFNPVTKSIFSIDKIQSLGWEPRTPLKIGILHSIEELNA